MKLKVILISFLIIFLIFFALMIFKSNPDLLNSKQSESTSGASNDTIDGASLIEKQLTERLSKLEVTPSNIKHHHYNNDSTIEIRASIPRGRPMEWIVWTLTSKLQTPGYFIADSYYESEEKGCRVQFNCKKKGMPTVVLILLRSSQFLSTTAKMAIYIENFGFQADQKSIAYLSFPEPMTVGLIPEKNPKTWIAQIANEYHKEIVIMLPMEPVSQNSLQQTTSVILVHYPDAKVKEIITDAMNAIPHFAGMTNYFGARIVDDNRVMSLIYSEVAKTHGFFLYNPPVRSSNAESIAKKYNIPFRKIDVSLDSISSVSALQDTLRHCAMIAQKTGDVIVSSKPTITFITALKNELPVLKQNGIRLMYISDLVSKKSDSKN